MKRRREEQQKIIPLPCRQPPGFAKWPLLKENAIYEFDDGNRLIKLNDILPEKELATYLEVALAVQRHSGRSAYGREKPRKELCYSPDGQPYVYANVKHETRKFPSHVLAVLPHCLTALQRALGTELEYTELSNGVDILYDESFVGGGSIGAHRDDEKHWGMVLILSLGQTRYLRVRSDAGGGWVNVQLSHNSLTVMLGESFQRRYTHQVDKLHRDERVGARLSLNVRYARAV